MNGNYGRDTIFDSSLFVIDETSTYEHHVPLQSQRDNELV